LSRSVNVENTELIGKAAKPEYGELKTLGVTPPASDTGGIILKTILEFAC
jgi:hypothetical protein